MTPEEKAEILVGGWLSAHQQECIPNGLNQLKEIIADVIEQERDRKLRGGPFIKIPDEHGRWMDLSRITSMQIIPQGFHGGQEREVELRWWLEDPTKHNGYEMSREKAEEFLALWKEKDQQ